MHKGPIYELEPRYRVFAANNNYPSNWPAAKILVTTATWAGTAAASAPAAPFYLEPTGVTVDLHARYEHILWDNGGGDHAILAIEWSVFNLTQLKMRIMGDWGVNGSLPDNANYYRPPVWSTFSGFINGTSTPPEDFLRPTRLIWEANPY